MQHMNGGIREITIQPVVHTVIWVGGKLFDAAGGQTAVSRHERFVFNVIFSSKSMFFVILTY